MKILFVLLLMLPLCLTAQVEDDLHGYDYPIDSTYKAAVKDFIATAFAVNTSEVVIGGSVHQENYDNLPFFIDTLGNKKGFYRVRPYADTSLLDSMNIFEDGFSAPRRYRTAFWNECELGDAYFTALKSFVAAERSDTASNITITGVHHFTLHDEIRFTLSGSVKHYDVKEGGCAEFRPQFIVDSDVDGL